MKDKDWDKQKKRIQALIAKWHQPLGLKWWKIHHFYSDQNISSCSVEGRSALATNSTDWEYLEGSITWNMIEVLETDDETLEYTFVHECCHILVREMRQWANSEMLAEKKDEAMKHEERVVTQLAKAFLWVREAGGEDAVAGLKKEKKKTLDNLRK